MPHLSRTALINASPEQVFAYVDDIRNLARHMSESPSMPMMGSKLKLEIVTPEPTGVGATYRYTGKMLGLVLDFSETVTTYIAGREKIWRTIGDPKLLIMRGYEADWYSPCIAAWTTNAKDRRCAHWRDDHWRCQPRFG